MLAGILLEFLLDAREGQVFFAMKRLQALRYGVGGCIHRYIVKFQSGSVNSFLFKSYFCRVHEDGICLFKPLEEKAPLFCLFDHSLALASITNKENHCFLSRSMISVRTCSSCQAHSGFSILYIPAIGLRAGCSCMTFRAVVG
jgi:hypothetical protein